MTRPAAIASGAVVQTFLPYPDIAASLACLDDRRLGKQRVEALQILRALEAIRLGKPYGWKRHPAVRMWQGHDDLLALYLNGALEEWERRGFRNGIPRRPVATTEPARPHWWGDERLHRSHRANLLRKAPQHYGRFGWTEPPDLPYYWPA